MTEAFRRSDPEEGVFRLLVPSSDAASPEAASIDVAGQRWQIVDRGAVPSPANAPKYICVSYFWADGRTPNPFDPERPMSSRAQPALETAIATLQPPAIWLDAACMPSREPARSLCLQNMGAIYAAASDVLAVLSPSTSIVLETVRRQEAVGLEQLRLRRWLTARSPVSWLKGKRVIPSLVTSCSMLSVTQLRNADRWSRFDAYEFRKRYPHLDALETLIDDWLRADYAR
jgi:Heterokaryon incompatibility protein (HET)